MKRIDAQAIANAIQNRIAEQERTYSIYLKVLEVLKDFEGNKISKRIETAFRKRYPEHYCHFVYEYSRYYLVVSSTKTNDYNNLLKFLLGYDSENIITVDETHYSRGFKYFSNSVIAMVKH
jgi:hypothetical protein